MKAPISRLVVMAVIWLAAVPRPAIAAAPSQLDTAVLNRIKAATAYVVTTIPGQRETVTGSGFLITDGGLLLTNAHVVEDFLAYNAAHRSQPAKLEVIVFNSPDEARIITANVVALSRNPTLLADGTVSHLNDLALLQADCESPMAFLELGPADGLVETQQIYAAGYPLGIPEISIREGSISALRRDGSGGLAYIEHTAGLDAGNSGGPLITGSGEVIGINTWIAGLHANTAISAPVIRQFLAGSGRTNETAGTQPSPDQDGSDLAYREVLAWALKGSDETVARYIANHAAELDTLYSRIEKSAYQYGVIPEFALAVLSAESVYGTQLSWARKSSWDAYRGGADNQAQEYPTALADLDTALPELSAILTDLDQLDHVLAFYWCGPDGEWNKDSLFVFKESVLKMWRALAPETSAR